MSSNQLSTVPNYESLVREIELIFHGLFNQLIERRDTLLLSLTRPVDTDTNRESPVEANEVSQHRLRRFAGKFAPRKSKNKNTEQNPNSPKQFKYETLTKLQNMISKFGHLSETPSPSKGRKQKPMPHEDTLSVLTDTDGYQQQLGGVRETEEATRDRRDIIRDQDDAFMEAALIDQFILREKRERERKKIVSREEKLRKQALQEEVERVARRTGR